MAMVVRNNLMAYNANRQLGMNTSAVSKNIEKLSSGFKINRAADDAAGLAVSEKMKAQIKGLEQASANSQDGISLVQTAEGALTEVHDMLNRMTELATKSANGTIQDAVDRDAIQNEVNKLNAEIDRISKSTNFNGIKLLDGTMSGGASSGASGKGYSEIGTNLDGTADSPAKVGGAKSKNDVDLAASAAVGDAVDLELKVMIGDTVKTINVSGKATAATKSGSVAAVLADVQKALGDQFTVTDNAGKLTIEAKNAGTTAVQIVSAAQKNKGAAATTTIGTGTALVAGTNDSFTADLSGVTAGTKNYLTVDGKKFQILKQGEKATSGATAIYTDDGLVDNADKTSSVIAQLKKYGIEATATATDGEIKFNAKSDTSAGSSGSGGLTLQIGETGEDFNQVTVSVEDMSSNGIGTSGLDVSTQTAAKAAIETIRTGINKVSTNRGELGALQNRLEHTINNLDVSAENMTSANSRIRDTDMAKQMMEYTKMNVLQQSAQAMLATANQAPQSILQLLQ